MIGRPWERDRLRLEMGSHRRCEDGEQGAHCADRRTANVGQQQTVGRKFKNDSAPISFVFGESVVCNPIKTEADEANTTIDGTKREPEWANAEEAPNLALGNLDWVNNSQKSHVILQMMSAMGYEHGKGLGKMGQGIVEPIKSKPNPGKQVFGAHRHNHHREVPSKRLVKCVNLSEQQGGRGRQHLGEMTEDGRMARGQMDDGKDARDGGGARPNPSRKAQMNYEDNVKGTLRSTGLSDQSAEEIWQALGVLAKHKIMPLGMGLGLVKKRAGRGRFEAKGAN